MSLGVTDGNGDEIIYTSACDSDDTSGTAAQASEAAAYGIFVDASSGNSGNTSGIVSPSCGVNVTSVGSVTKADAISGYNSGPNLDLLAPGSSITSTILSSNFGSKSGTSMAAPHIAGAAALLLQYGRLVYNLNLTPTQVETKLKITGVQINDTRNGIIFPRVDLFAAIQPFLNEMARDQVHFGPIGAGIFAGAVTDAVDRLAALPPLRDESADLSLPTPF